MVEGAGERGGGRNLQMSLTQISDSVEREFQIRSFGRFCQNKLVSLYKVAHFGYQH